MPKTVTVTLMPEIQRWTVRTDNTGAVDGVNVQLLVNYGTEADPQNHSEDFDYWATLNVGEKTAFQQTVYAKLHAEVTAAYLT